MRLLLTLLLALPTMAFAQLCSEPSPVSYSGFGLQQTEADLSATENYLDALNTSTFSLGTGISDNNLCIQSNSDITTFLGVKLRNVVAPNDNTPAEGNVYFAEPGYSPDSQNGPAGEGPYANWNIIAYAGLNAGAFDSVDVIIHLDFNPCFGYEEESLLAINIGDELDNNIYTSASGISSFGINTNLGYEQIDALNNTGIPFDATVEGYYTFAIEVKDNCGNRMLWNEITVYVQSETTSSGSAVADANGNGVYDDNESIGCMDAAACNFDCSATTDSGCDFAAPVLSMSGVVETAANIADWASTDFLTTVSDDTGVAGTTFTDYAGRLDDGRYSVTRIYVSTDICGNSNEAGQLIVADATQTSGCTDPNATSYDAGAINDDGSCDYSPACLGDLNLDSIVGTSDLLILLSSFGLPCSE